MDFMSWIKLIITCCLFVICTNQLIAAPAITSVSPSNGPIAGGNVITITGSGFTGATAVGIGFRPATSFNVITDNSITAVVPAGTSGTFDVMVTADSQTSAQTRADFYTYTEDSWKGIISGINQDALTFFETSTNTITDTILLPADSNASVITPDGITIYAPNFNLGSVNVIDVATKTIIATIPTPVSGPGAYDIAVSPDGGKVYISNNLSGFVTVINTTTNLVEANIFVAVNLGSLSITPNGNTVYVANFTFGNVTTIDTATNTVSGSIITGSVPGKISITPNGTTAFVANFGSNTVSVIDIATNTVTNTIIFPPGSQPFGSTNIPDGSSLYVVAYGTDSVSEVDIDSNVIVDTIPFPPGSDPFWVVVTPDGNTLYVINEAADDVIPIDVATNTIGPAFAQIPGEIQDVIMSPDQAPVASFFVVAQTTGFPTIFNASDSISPIGTIATYAWDFGDGTTVTTTTPIVNHTYNAPGSYNAVLTVTNSAGTSTTKVFLSQNMSNNGGPNAVVSQLISIGLSPPENVRGFQRSCRFPTQTDLINVIRWRPPSAGEQPVAYRIYRDAALTNLVATIPANGTLEFIEHNRQKNKIYTYYIVSVSATGAVSSPVLVTIKPQK